MIETLNIFYSINNINIRLDIPIDDNLPYNIAEAFIRVIKDSDANTDIIMGELKEHFGDEDTI